MTGLRDVRVSVPKAARRGDSVILHCHYDLEGDPLYAIKWYKGRAEFYRYTPKEKPPMKLFPIPGLSDLVVDVSIGSSRIMPLFDKFKKYQIPPLGVKICSECNEYLAALSPFKLIFSTIFK